MERNFWRALFIPLFICAFIVIPAAGQDQDNMVKFTPDFRFREGIYINFEHFKTKNPIPTPKLLTSTDYNDREFFKKLFESGKIYYYDNMGIRQEIVTKDIWGYSRNGILYIQVQENFTRITFVGSICHFVADITTYDPRYYNSPYGYYDPYSSYYSPYSMYPYYGYGGYYPGSYYPYRSSSIARSEVKQYLIDFESGKVVEFDMPNTQMFLAKDPELYAEFLQLPRKKRKDMMFFYIRKFNERNPLYLPVNE